MLDQKDLELLKDMMESVILKSEKRVDAQIGESDNMLLDEMYRIQASTEKRLDRVESRLESMQHDINANKLEAGTIDILSMRMDRLENRIAPWRTGLHKTFIPIFSYKAVAALILNALLSLWYLAHSPCQPTQTMFIFNHPQASCD